MKRLYLSKMTLADGEAMSAIERAIDAGEAGTDATFSVVSKINPDGTLGHPYALVVVEARRHNALIAHPDNYVLPEFPLDARIGVIHAATKTTMRNALAQRGFPLETLDDDNDSFRGLVRAIGRAIQPAFDETAFDSGQ